MSVGGSGECMGVSGELGEYVCGSVYICKYIGCVCGWVCVGRSVCV